MLAMMGVASVASPALSAQTVRFKLEGVGLTYQEIADGREGDGGGGGAGIELRLQRLHLDVRSVGVRVLMKGDQADFDLQQVDVRVGYFLTEFLALEVGGGRRYISPDFAAPEVGFVRIGFYSENHIQRAASVWVRGAYLPDPQFNTGGSADLSFEFALGVGLGTTNGRFRVHAEYEFQRIDREVNLAAVPLQLSLARLGIGFGF